MVSGCVVVMVDTRGGRRRSAKHSHTSHRVSTDTLCIPSSSVDPTLLSPPTSTPIPPSVFYSQSTPNQNASIPTSTPILNKTSGNHSYASDTHDRDSANYRLAQETSEHFLGAMPPQKFLDMFLPIGQDTPVSELRWSFHERIERN